MAARSAVGPSGNGPEAPRRTGSAPSPDRRRVVVPMLLTAGVLPPLSSVFTDAAALLWLASLALVVGAGMIAVSGRRDAARTARSRDV